MQTANSGAIADGSITSADISDGNVTITAGGSAIGDGTLTLSIDSSGGNIQGDADVDLEDMVSGSTSLSHSWAVTAGTQGAVEIDVSAVMTIP